MILKEGVKIKNGITYINPKKYCELFLKAFEKDGRIWNYEDVFTCEDLEKAKLKIIKKFKTS